MNTSLSQVNPVVRAVLVIGSIAALVSGITFAALSSTATLTNNTIASATADLQVDNTDSTTTGFGSTDSGFAFTGVVPGGVASSVGNFQLKNNGGTSGANLAVTVKLDGPVLWTVLPGTATSPADTDVHVLINCSGGITVALDKTLADLATEQTLGTLNAATGSEVATCNAKVSIPSASAFTGSSLTSDTFNFVFNGTAV